MEFFTFSSGFSGGHCIGVDPYYLTYKAQSIGYNPGIILSGRRINDGMGEYVVSRLVKLMLKKRLHVQDSNVLIMGLTFKENCPDLRNTRVVDIIKELETYGVNIHVYDPWVDPEEAVVEYGIKPIATLEEGRFDAIVLAVAHEQFKQMDIKQVRALGKPDSVIYDLKYLFPADLTDERL
jgi:UDP-N-acetyl-D-galactosamine dehydrogenase